MRGTRVKGHYLSMTTLSNASSRPVVPPGAGDDRRLLALVATGDRSAFGMLYDRHAPAVHAFSRSHCAHREDAEEVTQDVFVTLWNRRRTVTIASESLLPWLLVTCRNKIANQQRAIHVHSRRRAFDGVDDATPSREAGPEALIENEELQRAVDAAISSLAQRDRDVFHYCIIEGLSYDDAAALIGVTKGVIRNRLSRLRAQLRNEISTLRGTP